MRAAKIEKSDRLARVYRLLSNGSEFTTRDIIQNANVCAVSAIIAELRENGREIICQRRGDKWFYRMQI